MASCLSAHCFWLAYGFSKLIVGLGASVGFGLDANPTIGALIITLK